MPGLIVKKLRRRLGPPFTVNGALIEKDSQRVSMRCPICRVQGMFEPLREMSESVVVQWAAPASKVYLTQRGCPNPNCRAHVFVAYKASDLRVVVSYPPERITFDAAKIPVEIVKSLEEAITCHAAGAYRASAIMVRRTVEVLCDDQGIASSRRLGTRIDALEVKLPPLVPWLDGLHELKLLGNDAAHVVLKDFDRVGAVEAKAAIDLMTSILQITYQHTVVIGRLTARKKKATRSNP